MFISNVYFICEPKMSFKIHEASVVEKKPLLFPHSPPTIGCGGVIGTQNAQCNDRIVVEVPPTALTGG